ncbi:MAG: DUF3623 domain-containing protein [Parvularculaceae bacterium]|nr:DUF3623 domain-containing protein [Parvularculaceae bacterium]
MTHAAPILTTVFLWWSSTLLILWLANRSERQHAMITGVATCIMLAAMLAAIGLRSNASTAGAYWGFLTGLTIWAWHELIFLVGYVCGPRKAPCPPGLSTRERFWVSTQAILHHELSLAAHGLILALISVNAANAVAGFTFLTLWVLRLLAKLMVFFGAPNIDTDFLPKPIQHLSSYFRTTSHRTASWIGLTLISLMAMALIGAAVSASPGSFDHAYLVMLSTLVGLAFFEVSALVIKIPDRYLWSWALRAPSQQTNHNVASNGTGQ